MHLFSDTILNNITLQDNNISFLRVKDAAKDIKIDDFISSLPNGYNYNVKERGVGLSTCLLYTSPSPRDKRQSRMPSSA